MASAVLTSAADDFVTILRDSITNKYRLLGLSMPTAARMAGEDITKGLLHCKAEFPNSFEYACREMGIPPTLEAIANLSTEKE